MSDLIYLPQRSPASVGSLTNLPSSLQRLAPAIGWMDVDAARGASHLSIPSDLYLITVYCKEGFTCGEASDGTELEVMVSTLRTRPALFSSHGHGHLAVALLTPIGLLNVLRTPVEGLADKRVPLDHFCGRHEQRRLRDLLVSAPSVQARMEAFGQWIESRATARRSLSLSESRVAQATTALQATTCAPASDVTELMSSVAISRRQLERDFRKWIGVAPAMYLRLVRFQRAAAAITEGMALGDAAAAYGFADQPHLNRVVREFANVTPRELRLDASSPPRSAARTALAGRILSLNTPAGFVATTSDTRRSTSFLKVPASA